MNDILIVPDVHGRSFWLPALDYSGEVIFLGDYVDPYPQEGVSVEEAYQALLKIVKFKQENPDRVVLLLGNHEMQYFNSDFGAGRFSRDYEMKFREILTGDETKGLFQICKQIGKYLFIHAGLTKHWYDRHYDDFKDLGATLEEQLTGVFFKKMRVYYEAGEIRGGWDKTGSPLWADYREFEEEELYKSSELIQIIGHTQTGTPDPIITDKYWLLDNKQLYLLHNDAIEKYKV